MEKKGKRKRPTVNHIAVPGAHHKHPTGRKKNTRRLRRHA